MSTYKRGDVYWYRFMWEGRLIRESTRQPNDKTARQMESAHRARLAKQAKEEDAARERLGCTTVVTCHECERLFNADKALKKDANTFCTARCAAQWAKARTTPTLKSFLEGRFIPDAEIRHKGKPATIRYYRQGADMLNRSRLASLRLDELTGEHAQQFAGEFRKLSPSGINRGLRTLRRALNLALEWGQLDKPVKVALAKGEVQRDRVLTENELNLYLNACPQPWRDCAAIIAEEGMRPGEVFALRWVHVFLGEGETGLIRVVHGKSKAARRVLPMTPSVFALLSTRHKSQGFPGDGWIFPSRSLEGHITQDGVKGQHKRALSLTNVAPFPPYLLRHTALTTLAKAARGDVFALAKIAGHSTIAITQRYIHPEAETIDQVFLRAKEQRVGTILGTIARAKKALPRG